MSSSADRTEQPASAADDPLSPARRRVVDRSAEVARFIPEGRVLTYGDIAEIIGDAGPRQVGWAMAHGDATDVPWWRVVNASGELPSDLRGEADAHYRAEGTPYREDRQRVDLRRARMTPVEWIALEEDQGFQAGT